MSDEKAARLAAIRAANAARKREETAPAGTPATATTEVLATAAPPPAARRTAAADTDEDPQDAISLQMLLAMQLAAVGGALAAVFVLPAWAPGLSASLLGPEPKAYWYLSRSSAVVAYLLLWLSMALGLAISGKWARIWPGGPTVFALHQHTSLLALALGLFHALILLGDRYIAYTPAQLLLPFAGGYKPLWVGLGQLALYLLALVSMSFYVKKTIGQRAWRAIHYLSFAVFLLALAHGVMSGSDSGSGWARLLYWSSGGSLLFLLIYRCLMLISAKEQKA